MKHLLSSIEKLKKSETKKIIDSRIKEFKDLGRKADEIIFSELCFCILTANYAADKSIKIQYNIGSGFCSLSEKQLAGKLKLLGHRYPNARAKYIAESRKHLSGLRKRLGSFAGRTAGEENRRRWVVDNVKGLGYKEASHFLRNIGYDDYAIIDFHIVDLLVDNGLIARPKTLTKKKYLEIEELLKIIAGKSGLTLAELDLYLWFLETGKVLK